MLKAIVAILLLGACPILMNGQESPNAATATIAVPPLVRFSGYLKDVDGRPLTGVVGVTFAIYKEQQGGAPIWIETKNVRPDASGRYTVLLGSTKRQGLPLDVFSSGEARWISIRAEHQPEQSRVSLVSVPYALKAADAETIGGKPASAFVLAQPQASTSAASTTAGKTVTQANTPLPANITGSGKANFIADWTSSTNLGSSLIFQTPTTSTTPNRIGVNTIAPAAQLDAEAPSSVSTGIQGVTPSTAFFAAGVFGHATGATGVTRGVYGVSASANGIGVHGIAATGGQFETGSGLILKGRGAGSDRFTLDATGNMHNTGNYRVDGGVSVGGSGQVAVDAPGVTAGRFVILPNGNVGINKSSPTNKLNVVGSNAAGEVVILGSTLAVPGTGVSGTAGADGTGVSGVGSVPGGCGGLELCSTTGVSGSASGSTFNTGVAGSVTGGGTGVSGSADTNGIGVQGTAPNTGVQGIANSTTFFAAAVWGHATASTGVTRGVYGNSDSSSGIGVHGISATGGQFETGSGNEIIGRGFGHTNFRVDANGKVFADGGFQAGGADFAESFRVKGDRQGYEPGDLLAIDPSAERRIALASSPYSRLVAGIYSTRPGLLGTPHNMADASPQNEVPLAIVGVVPCKVTVENGPIRPGDLLVSSGTPGYAMRASDRKRMVGAVVGKALEPLMKGKGLIQVLVTLQ